MTSNTVEDEYNQARTGGTINEEGLKLLANRKGCTLAELKAFLGLPPTNTSSSPPGQVFTCAGERNPEKGPHQRCYQERMPSNPGYVACPVCQTDAFTVLRDPIPQP